MDPTIYVRSLGREARFPRGSRQICVRVDEVWFLEAVNAQEGVSLHRSLASRRT